MIQEPAGQGDADLRIRQRRPPASARQLYLTVPARGVLSITSFVPSGVRDGATDGGPVC